MPLYEYKCPDCSTTGERILPVAERNDQTCPVCDGPWELRVSVPRVISGEFSSKVRMAAFPGRPKSPTRTNCATCRTSTGPGLSKPASPSDPRR